MMKHLMRDKPLGDANHLAGVVGKPSLFAALIARTIAFADEVRPDVIRPFDTLLSRFEGLDGEVFCFACVVHFDFILVGDHHVSF